MFGKYINEPVYIMIYHLIMASPVIIYKAFALQLHAQLQARSPG